MKTRSLAAICLVVPLLFAGCATRTPDAATCPSDAEVAAMVDKFVALQPLPNPSESMTLAGALCGRDKFNLALVKPYGRVIGYKAGLTNPAVQKRFNYPQPVRGTLYEKMMLKDGAEVPARFGARPLFEADLLVEVKSSAIHDARTPLEVLRHLSAIIPFIELPDLVVEDPSKIGGVAINLINVGARLGVLGAPLPVQADEATVAALRDMTVRLLDGDGKELDVGKGSAILDQPLNAVIWLANDLKQSGITLKAGDLLSLGSFSKLLPPKPGTGAKVVYEGLPGNPSVSVRFK